MKVKIEELHKVFEILLKHQEENGTTFFEVPYDYYWDIKDKKYDSYDTPEEFTLGQLSMDWENLQDLLDGKHEPIRTDLKWLGQILIAIADSK